MRNKVQKSIVVTGPTASGKTSLAVGIAQKYDCEIISIDSRQVYRGMDIGTGKDLEEYKTSGGGHIPFHLIDVEEPSNEYNLVRFCQDAVKALQDIQSRGKVPLLCGGTALYLNALLKDYELPGGPPDPDFRRKLERLETEEILRIFEEEYPLAFASFKDVNNRNRIIRTLERAMGESQYKVEKEILPSSLILGVYYPRKLIHERIMKRLDQRLQNGLLEEVERLHNEGISWEKLEYFGLEYKFIALFLQGEMDYDVMREKLLAGIRKLAKAQDVWFRRMERDGEVIHWLERGSIEKASALIDLYLAGKDLPEPEIMMSKILYGPDSNKNLK